MREILVEIMPTVGIISFIALVYALSRHEGTDEYGAKKISYRFSPLGWIKRFRERVTANKKGYSEDTRVILSVLHTLHHWTYILTLIMGSLLFWMASYFLYGKEYFWVVLGIAVFLTALIWLFFVEDNPFKR